MNKFVGGIVAGIIGSVLSLMWFVLGMFTMYSMERKTTNQKGNQ